MNAPLSEPLAEVMPVTDEEVKAVAHAMRTVPLTTLWGDHEVRRFEEEFAALFGAAHAVAVTSGTTALHASLMAAGIGPGDEVIVTPFSFVASVSVVIQVGATPVFADIDPETFVLDPADVGRKVTSRTRAVLPVHQCGYPVNMTSLLTEARQHGLTVIEDCAAAHGARVGGLAVGTFGDFGCFSFNIGKIMRTGEGGMVLTRSKEMAQRLRAIRVNGLEFGTHGARVTCLGTNFTMCQPVAALGRVQVRRFLELSLRRRQIGEVLRSAIARLPVVLPPDRPGLERAWYSLPFLLDDALAERRDAVVHDLRALGVPAGRGNAELLHQIEYVRRAAVEPVCPIAERVRPRMFFLDPLPVWTDEQVAGVAQGLRDVILRHARKGT